MDNNLFNRLNQAEPFVAIRLLLLQAGIAIGLYWIGNATGAIPEDFNLFPLNLMGIFNTEKVLELGYPMREVVWSGEWWRLLIGIILPPGLGWFAFSAIAWGPLGKLMEEETGRPAALLIYLLGGMVVVLVDTTSSAVITAGSLGMAFAAGGAVLVKLGLDRREGPEKLAVVPAGTWMALLLLWVFSWTLSYAPMIPPSVEYAWLTQIGPTQKGLTAALLMGAAGALPILVYRRTGAIHGASGNSGTLSHRWIGLLILVPLVVFAGISAYCAFTWKKTGSIDYQIWRDDPSLLKGDPEAQERLKELAQSHPGDLFLSKRLAISYVANRQYTQAREVLDQINDTVKTKNSSLQARFLKRRFRVAGLNRRSVTNVGPWRQSGFSGNYDVDPLRILWDKGHVARLEEATAELEAVREQLLKILDTYLPPLMPTQDKDNHESKERQSLILNHQAYVRCELGGDLAKAVQEASMSVSLSPSGDNLDTLGWIEVRRGQLDTGITHLEKALLFDEPHSAGTIHFHLGMAFHLKGDPTQAREHFAQALKYDLEWWDELTLKEVSPETLEAESPPS